MEIAALILAAGQGTRMKSARAKVVHEALGRPLVSWPIDCAQALGATEIVLVLGHQKEDVEACINAAHPGHSFAYTEQKEQNGTGHAARVGLDALPDFSGTVLVLYGDTPLLQTESLRALCDARVAQNAPLALWTTKLADPTGYGRIVRDASGAVRGIVEHKDATEAQRKINEVNPGMYAVDAAFLRDALAALKNENAQGEYYLTDIVAMAADAHDGPLPSLEVDDEQTLGVNDRVQLAQATGVLKSRVLTQHMRAGVTLMDPPSTWIEANVEIGQDTIIAPGVHIGSGCRIGANCHIGQGAHLTRTRIDDDVTVLPYSMTEDAVMESGAQLGPFGRLRPGAELGAGAKVGNFVEVKKSRLGAGAKANHLAYIGDADIGAKSNVGAGTITCNYDGFGKHQTTLGEGVFIGSNSTLVAPVTIASNAYVGAGSVIAKDVPSGDLAIGRARQDNKAGYADKIRKRYAARKARLAAEKG